MNDKFSSSSWPHPGDGILPLGVLCSLKSFLISVAFLAGSVST